MLSVQQVCKFYNKKTALDHVSLEAQTGRIFGLLGPNGAGKTSLIRIITMITAPDKGEVLLDGEKLSRQAIEKTGYMPEERGLYKKMEILDQVLYFARLKGMDETSARREMALWFERLGMTDWRKKKVEELSKGMQQKVQFVITVIHKPKLIILDEPFTGFDPVNAELVKNEIIRLRNEGATILLSTHRMESVEELCDDIALINNGQLVLSGEVNEVRRKFATPFIELDYDGATEWTPRSGTIVESDMLRSGHTRSIIRLNEGINTNDLLRDAVQHVSVHRVQEQVPAIKDIFIQLVGGNEHE